MKSNLLFGYLVKQKYDSIIVIGYMDKNTTHVYLLLIGTKDREITVNTGNKKNQITPILLSVLILIKPPL